MASAADLLISRFPNEVISNIIRSLDDSTIEGSIANIPPLKELITLYITDSVGDSAQGIQARGNSIAISDIITSRINLDALLQPYHFFVFDIENIHGDDQVYYKTHKLLARLKKFGKVVKLNYWSDKIDLNYLKMFKSLYHQIPPSQYNKYQLIFHKLKEIKCNSNHLLLAPFVSYCSLSKLNLYYGSSTFYFQVFDHLNLKKYPDTLPALTYLKIQDYMSESENQYSRTSDNHIRTDDDDDDEFDYNSDIDENEFYFDGLEIIRNFIFTKLERLTLKNCSISKFERVQAPKLTALKILELSNRHTDAYDLNLINNDDEEIERTTSFLRSSVSSRLKILNNDFPELRSLKIIGHLWFQSFNENIIGLKATDEIIIKTSNIELKEFRPFVSECYNKTRIRTIK